MAGALSSIRRDASASNRQARALLKAADGRMTKDVRALELYELARSIVETKGRFVSVGVQCSPYAAGLTVSRGATGG